jgi:hypothetical protein
MTIAGRIGAPPIFGVVALVSTVFEQHELP